MAHTILETGQKNTKCTAENLCMLMFKTEEPKFWWMLQQKKVTIYAPNSEGNMKKSHIAVLYVFLVLFCPALILC